MTGLLDTQIVIRMDQDPDRLSGAARRVILGPTNWRLFVWEMVVKASPGKLDIPDPASVFLDRQLASGLELFGSRLPHGFATVRLPAVHRDPFDRLILAQAVTVGIPAVSADEKFPQYPDTVIW